MASLASNNDVKLPRPVLRMSQEIRDRIESRKQATEQATSGTKVESAPAAPPVASPENPPPAPPAPPQQATDPRHADPAYWQHRHDVAEGRLRAERARYDTALEQKDARIAELEAQVQSLQAKSPTAPVDTDDLKAYFTPEEIDKYGEEGCRKLIKTAKAAAKSEIETIVEARLKPLQDKVKNDKATTERDTRRALTDKLYELRPDWQEVDQKWRSWLAGEDPETGFVRQAILNNHMKRGADGAPGVVKLMEQYEHETSPPAPPAAPAPPAPPVAPAGSAAPASDVAPPPPAAAGAGKAPTDKEVKDFYKRAGLGQVTDEERTAFEARMKLRGRQ